MTYLQNVIRILSLDATVYHDLEKNNRLFTTAFINVFLAGLFFGLANLYHARFILQQEGISGFDSPAIGALVYLILIIASIAQIFLSHAGFSLLLWAMSKGVKGQAGYFPVYLHTGAAIVPLWLGLPIVALYGHDIISIPGIILGVIGLAWTGATIMKSIMSLQKFNAMRAIFSLSITIIFIIAFYSLWWGFGSPPVL